MTMKTMDRHGVIEIIPMRRYIHLLQFNIQKEAVGFFSQKLNSIPIKMCLKIINEK